MRDNEKIKQNTINNECNESEGINSDSEVFGFSMDKETNSHSVDGAMPSSWNTTKFGRRK